MSSDHEIHFEIIRIGTGFRSEIVGNFRVQAEWNPQDGFDTDLARIHAQDDVTGDWHRIDDDKDFSCITDAIKRELKSGKHDPDEDEYHSAMRDSAAEDRAAFRRAG